MSLKRYEWSSEVDKPLYDVELVEVEGGRVVRYTDHIQLVNLIRERALMIHNEFKDADLCRANALGILELLKPEPQTPHPTARDGAKEDNNGR